MMRGDLVISVMPQGRIRERMLAILSRTLKTMSHYGLVEMRREN